MARKDGTVRGGFTRYECPECKQYIDINNEVEVGLSCGGPDRKNHRPVAMIPVTTIGGNAKAA